jgi:mannose-6-phosphate isomerase
MDWYPLELTAPVRDYAFGGRAIAEHLGREGLPGGTVAETWEVSDVGGSGAEVVRGSLAGRSLRSLTLEHPAEVVGPGWEGTAFPLLTKFIDASGTLPVHLHPDDADARRVHGEPNGKTEAWHILDAVPGATALIGVLPGTSRAVLREALVREDYDAVLRRVPVRSGDTVYVPAGTPHSFGPGTLVHEIEQTSDLQEQVPPRTPDADPGAREEAVDRLLDQCRTDLRPMPHPGLVLHHAEGVQRTVCCAGPHFALDRWRVGSGALLSCSPRGAVVLGNAGAPVRVRADGRSYPLGRARTLLLPAALRRVEVTGPADLLAGYLPDLERDVRAPLLAAGYGRAAVAALGEGLDGDSPGSPG